MRGQLPNYELCYVCGHANPMGLNVRFRWDSEEGAVTTRFRPNPLHAGFPGRLHGGVALLEQRAAPRAVVCGFRVLEAALGAVDEAHGRPVAGLTPAAPPCRPGSP